MSYFLFYQLINKVVSESRFDIIQFEYSESAFFIKKIVDSVTVLNMHDVVSRRILLEINQTRNIFIKNFKILQYTFFRIFEGRVIKNMDHILVRSKIEKEFVEKYFQTPGITIMPLVVGPVPKIDRKEPGTPTILFVAAFNRRYNEMAAIYLIQKIFIPLQREIPDLKLVLAGNGPSQNLLQNSSGNPNIKITGFVENLSDQYLNSTIFVSPIFSGGGMIYKNMEAMSYGLPVLTTDQANEGLHGINGMHLLISNSPDQFIEQSKKLLFDIQFRHFLGDNGKQFIDEQYSSDRILGEYREFILRLREKYQVPNGKN